MWTHSDRPFKGVDKITAATEFISAAERLIARDVSPRSFQNTLPRFVSLTSRPSTERTTSSASRGIVMLPTGRRRAAAVVRRAGW